MREGERKREDREIERRKERQDEKRKNEELGLVSRRRQISEIQYETQNTQTCIILCREKGDYITY